MAAPISVIVPTLNAAETLPATLGALVPGLERGLIRELVMSDGGSKDATARIAEEAGAVIVSGATGRGAQIAAGAAAARGDWLLILHADTVLGEGWCDAVAAHMAQEPDRAGYFSLRFRAVGVAPAIVAGWANLRARLLHLPFGDQGLLISARLLDEVGGVPQIPLMEDMALARRLGPRLRPLDAVALTSAERYRREGWVRRGLGNLFLQARYLAGADPVRLARHYDAGASSEN